MTIKGKHSSGGSGPFYRDLIMMILAIILVGAAVFFLLFLLADKPTPTTTSEGGAVATTSTTEAVTTTAGDGATTTTTAPTTTTTVPVRPPEEVRVVVLNSVGIAGAAGRLTEQVEEAGYQTLPAGDYSPQLDPSRIWYRPSFSAEANQLLVLVPSANVEPLPEPDLQEGADVIIILGTGYEE